jgi:hypothetical protein
VLAPASFLTGYAFFWSPNDLGVWKHDLPFLGRMCSDNAITFVLFNCLGLMPATMGLLLWPAYKSSGNQVR